MSKISKIPYKKNSFLLILRHGSSVVSALAPGARGPRFYPCFAKIVIIFLTIKLNMCFGYIKNRLNETVLLSTHNVCFA